jgi:hypothetical protein
MEILKKIMMMASLYILRLNVTGDMEILKKIMMMASLVFCIICFGASAWMAYSLPSGNSDVSIFVLFALIFLAAAVWFGMNVFNLIKSQK